MKIADQSTPPQVLTMVNSLIFMGCSRIIWLGDLNYRISLSYEETKMLLEENDWNTLLDKDQVRYTNKKVFRNATV